MKNFFSNLFGKKTSVAPKADSVIATPPAPRMKLNKFFLAGKELSILWREVSNKDEAQKRMEQWIRNPFTKRFEWSGNHLGEWEDDKIEGIKEVSMFVAESRFPGSVRSLLNRSQMRGK